MKMKKFLSNLFILVVAFASFGKVFSQGCPPELVSYWKMDETSGTTLVDYVNGNNATRNTTTGSIAGKVDNSQRFTYVVNGSNNAYLSSEYAVVPNNSDFDFGPNSSFTICYWFRFNTSNNWGYGFQDHIIVSKGDWNFGAPNTAFWASGTNGSAKVNFMLKDAVGTKTDLEGSTTFQDLNWHFVTCVRNGATDDCILYVDGTITDQANVNYSASFTNTKDIYIGSLTQLNVPQYFEKGDVDEIAIYNKALTKPEIDAIILAANNGDGHCSSVSTPPTITSTAITTASEGVAYSYDVNATGSPTPTYSLTTNPAGMTINSTSGLISWTPSSVGDFDVEVEADNGEVPAATQSFTITVSGLSPNITSTPITTATVDEEYSYTVHATGTQAGMTYSLITFPAGMSIDSDAGTITWTPSASGSELVEVEADNGINPTDVQSFTITIEGINPIITSVPVTSGYVGALYNYTVHASGKQTGMTYSLLTNPAGMTINPTSGLISWTPSAAGDFDVEVEADNGEVPADVQSYSISVSEVYNCPDDIISLHHLDEAAGPIYADFYGEYNATAIVSPTSTTGIIGNAQLFAANTKINIPDNGTAYDWLSNRSFSIECWVKTSTTDTMVFVGRNRTDYVAARWFVGTNSTGKATFELRDNGEPNTIITGTSNIADNNWHHIVAVRDDNTNFNRLYVDGVQEASVSKNYDFSFKADVSTVITLGYLKGLAGQIESHFIGSLDEVAIFNRALRAAEIDSFYNNGVPTPHCANGNNPPRFTSSPVTSVNEDAGYFYSAVVTDNDVADPLSISIKVKPTWINFSYTAGLKNASLSGTPTNNNVGDNDVVLRVSDGEMTRDQIFRIVVNNVNDAPVKTSTPVTTAEEGEVYTYNLTVSDVDASDLINMTVVTKPSWLTFTHVAGEKTATLSGTPGNANVGANAIDISITDGTATIHEIYSLTVTSVNDGPTITGQDVLSVNEDQSIEILKSDLTIVDVDNDPSELTITVQSGTNYTFTGNTVIPIANFNGQLSVNVIASDLIENSPVYPVILTVNPVNDIPVITSSPSVTAEEGTLYTYTLTVTDIDVSDVITMTAVTKPSWLSFNWTAGSKTATLSGTPSFGDIGENAIDINITDGHVIIHEDYSITVTVSNDAPEITDQSSLSVDEDESLTILKSDLTIVDDDNAPSDITITVLAGTNYTFTGNTITPVANFNGLLVVNVIASDLSEDSPEYPVVVTVNAVNDMPIITEEPSLSSTVGVIYLYIFEATDVENATLIKSATTIPSWLSFSSGSGSLSGTPSSEDIGQHPVILEVTDGFNNVVKSFTINVSDPTAISETKNTDFEIYPVPVNNELNIKFNQLAEETTIDIISSTGSIIVSKIVSANTGIVNIDTQNIKAGIYFCHLRNNAINSMSRFVIVR